MTMTFCMESDTRRQLDFVGTTDSKEFREMRRKVTMYRDKLESLENQNKVSSLRFE